MIEPGYVEHWVIDTGCLDQHSAKGAFGHHIADSHLGPKREFNQTLRIPVVCIIILKTNFYYIQYFMIFCRKWVRSELAPVQWGRPIIVSLDHAFRSSHCLEPMVYIYIITRTIGIYSEKIWPTTLRYRNWPRGNLWELCASKCTILDIFMVCNLITGLSKCS